jgi:hypothetical protein
MTCCLCQSEISPRQRIEFHHPVYKSKGGKLTAPAHYRCHRTHHRASGDFRAWGKRGAASGAWAFHLKNVKTHPAYESTRWRYLMSKGLVGWAAGLI